MPKWQKPTIAFVPREFLNLTADALENLIDNTPEDYDLIVVAAGYPEDLVENLKKLADRVGARILTFAHFLSPNQSRNAALAYVETDYVVFVDHDVFVEPGWLPPLLSCAQETKAAIVAPVTYEGRPRCHRIHMAGGIARVEEDEKGVRKRIEKHHFAHQNVKELEDLPVRGETELAEFHCVLVESDWIKSMGGFDEKLLSTAEHWDMSMQARLQGRSIYLEPASKVTYTPPTKATFDDLRWFNMRWSNDWNNASLQHLAKKYELTQTPEMYKTKWRFLKKHQKLRLIPVKNQVKKRFGKVAGTLIYGLVTKPVLMMRELLAHRKDMDAWLAVYGSCENPIKR